MIRAYSHRNVRRAALVGLVLVGMAAAPRAARGQSAVWLPQGATSGDIYYSNGNVGVGTTSPATKLHVSGVAPWVRLTGSGANWSGIQFENAALTTPVRWALYNGASGQGGDALSIFDYTVSADRFTIASSGNVGIGTSTPGSKLTVLGAGSSASGQTDLQVIGTGTVGSGINLVSTDSGGRNWALLSTGSLTGVPGSFGLYDATVAAYRFVVNSSGNVGIGTMIPGSYKLAVEGKIGAREVVVTNTPAWSDHVFRPGYRLRPLTEVAAFIRQHQHLPEIPSEAEVKQNGISVGEMQAKLLAKIEELTLHMIELDKQNKALREEIEKLRASR